ncbi:MAG: hypothetical protein H6Q57_2242, partial [Geobacteraceae bacterium]|nr:hypothetical protein [Geobacteraceae bacterium]
QAKKLKTGVTNHDKIVFTKQNRYTIVRVYGEMSERLKEHDWKSCVR